MQGRKQSALEVVRSDLSGCRELEGVVVVIDVLRSFSTAAYALAAGAARVVAAPSLESLRALRVRYPDALTAGALPGGAPAPGFDIGNSPAALARQALVGRTFIQHTAGGVRGLVDAERASVLLATGLVCARATARLVAALAPPRVTLVVTGLWTDRDGDEDHACADLIEAFLRGDSPSPEPYERRVRQSSFGRRFGSGDPALPGADLDLCASADRFDFAIAVQRREGELRLRPLQADAFSITDFLAAR